MKTIADYVAETTAMLEEAERNFPALAAAALALGRAIPLMPSITPADTRPTLVATPVTTEAQAIEMGRIRHIQRAGFSADNTEIDDNRQRFWWQENHYRVNAYLYTYQGRMVGYGALLQRDDGTWVSSCAVLPGHEGRKFGGRILSHLIGSVEHEVYARALIANQAACALHNDREWEMTGEDGVCRFYRTRPKVRVEHSLSGYDYSEPQPEPPCGWWMGGQR
jgi:GNAT superfamily N-acetyltransferase